MAKKSKDDTPNTVVEDLSPRTTGSGEREVPATPLRAPAPKAEKTTPAKTTAAVVRLDVFLAMKIKPDQAAGFRYWAQKQKLRAMPLSEWQRAYDNFMTRSV